MADDAFQAQYVHWNKLKTRPEVEIVLSIPVEYENVAYEILGGMPKPGKDVWVGVAVLDPKLGRVGKGTPQPDAPQPTTAAATAPPHEEPASVGSSARVLNPYSRKAGMLCNDVRFQRFLEERFGPRHSDDLPSWATERLRELCGVESRKDIKPNTAAADRFDRLVWAYEAEAHI